MTSSASHRDTRAIHGGGDDLAALGVHVPPIDLSTTYPLPDVDSGGSAYETLASGLPADGGSMVYQRLWNPTVARFETALAGLEDCEEGVAFATGMAALSACLLATVAAGTPHVVAVRPLYGGSDHLLDTGLLGTTVTWSTADAVGRAIRPDTGLVVLETPANPSLELVDIADVVRQAGAVPVLVDNTFATPVLQQPARHGATLVLHSATKYIGGHGDAMGGVVATTSAWAGRLRRVRAVTGGLLHPLAAYQLHRGLQTLPIRVRAAQASAVWIAEWLLDHPAVADVRYPALPGGDPRRLLGRQLAGPGAMIAFTVVGGYAAAAKVAESCCLITHAVSLGGVDTLIQHPASLTHRPVASEAKPDAGLLRLSVGLEAPEDVIRDLAAALDLAATAEPRARKDSDAPVADAPSQPRLISAGT
jgi:cystathionine beta-lyase/cystathionine gamma-synthase